MSTSVVILVLLAVLVLFGVGAAAVGWLPGLVDVPADAADDGLPAGPLAAEDLEHARFALAFRGYRMSEVDDVFDRLASELAARDAEIATLRGMTAAPHEVPHEDDVEPEGPAYVSLEKPGSQDFELPS